LFDAVQYGTTLLFWYEYVGYEMVAGKLFEGYVISTTLVILLLLRLFSVLPPFRSAPAERLYLPDRVMPSSSSDAI
jgi:hypothetical protein